MSNYLWIIITDLTDF